MKFFKNMNAQMFRPLVVRNELIAEHAIVIQSYVSLKWFDLYVIGDEKVY
jgi:hypothetical protein